MRVKRDQDAVSASDVAVHPFDRVCINVWGRHFDGSRKVDNHLVVWLRVDDFNDCITNLDCILELGARVRLWRVFIEHVGIRNHRFHRSTLACSCQGNFHDALLVLVEDHATLQYRGRVVEVNDCFLSTLERFVGALDQRIASLGKNLNSDICWDVAVLDQ